MNKTLLTGLAPALTLAAGLAYAQAAKPVTVRGTIDTISSTMMDMTARDGSKMEIMLTPATTVTEIVPAKLSDVKANTYIGTAAVKQPDGTYRAMELQVFPEARRGAGLGTHPYNLTKKTTMTNGTVGAMTQTNGTVGSASSNGDMTLTVNDGAGNKTILVPATVPVVTYAPGTMADLTPGAHVLVQAVTGADGKVSTSRISVGKNGMTPPM